MHAVGGVADQGQAAPDGGPGEGQRQGIGPAGPDNVQRAQEIAETARQLPQEPFIVQRHDGPGQGRLLRPHDGGPVARQGQDGEGAGGQEAFVGDGAVGLFMGHGADDAGLRVGPSGDGDAGVVAGLRVAAVGAHHQGGGDGPPVGQAGPDSARVPLHGVDAGRGQDPHPLQAGQAAGQGAPDHPVFHHVAEGPVAGVALVVMEEQGRGPFADPDMTDGGGVAFHARPKAQAVE